MVTDPHGAIAAWNSAARELYGWSEEEALGRNITDLIPSRPAPGGPEMTGWEAGTSSGRSEYLVATRSGAEVHVEVRTQPVRDDRGRVVGVVGVSLDVTDRVLAAERLADSESRYRAHFSASLVPQVIIALDGVLRAVNPALCELMDLDEADLIGRPLGCFAHPDDRADMEAGLAMLSDGGAECWKVERRLMRRDGSVIWIESIPSVVRDEEGRPAYVVVMVVDITERKRTEDMLRTSQRQTLELLALSEAIQATAPVAWGVFDLESRVVRVNDTMANLAGCRPEDLVGCPVEEALPDLCPRFIANYRRVLETGAPDAAVEVVGGSPASQPSFWLCNYYPVQIDGEVVAVGVVAVDVSDTKRAEAFQTAVVDTMAEGLYAVDTAGRITFANRAAGRMLGWGVDELRGRDAHETLHIQKPDGTAYPRSDCPMGRVRRDRRTARVVDEVFTRRDGTLLPVAYSAAPLYSQEVDHGIVVVFRDATDERQQALEARRALEELSWVGRIRDALDEDRLVLYSQPIASLRGGALSTEELLIRMITPSGETVLPGVFLPTAEKYGLIAEIDRWVVRQAAGLAASGRRVEANVSAETVSQPDFVGYVARELQAAGADPSLLVLELTETALMRDLGVGEDFARAVTDMGCELALDDFGTGFGSFTYLKRLPVSYLKIDQEFVRDLAASPGNRHVVQAIVSLARAFGQRTIAEGVEDAATLGILADLGVDFAQGFEVGRPRPVHDGQ